jgi:phosphoglycolate phosphatase-like HAD superfamily hydrolase
MIDWSGVVSDDRKPVYEANMLVLKTYGVSRIPFDEWLPRTTLSPRELFARMGLSEDPEVLFKEYQAALVNVRESGVAPFAYPDAEKFFHGLKEREIKIIVVSSHPKDHLLAEADEYRLTPYVSRFVGSARDKTQEIMRVLGKRSPRKAVYLGDTIYDIQAARKAGVVPIGVATGYHTRLRLEMCAPRLVVDSLSELLEHF